ncbi:hypothetical protein K7432_014399 [Basidiobolus ranarum]|uniref:Ankyrin repeat protein n=1 Tax=Basidiobolus ranarum TaxID=34480 RepID=A0ABR2WHV1_9FUNG
MTLLTKPNLAIKKPKGFINLGLHSGAAAGNLGLVKFALDHGQAINSVIKGVLPIHAACCSGNVIVVEYLIQRGADVNIQSFSKAYTGHADGIRGDSYPGFSALHYAVANGDSRMVELLLRHGAKVDNPDKYGITPLTIALAKQYLSLAILLEQYHIFQKQGITTEEKLKLPTPKEFAKPNLKVEASKISSEQPPPSVVPSFNNTNAKRPKHRLSRCTSLPNIFNGIRRLSNPNTKPSQLRKSWESPSSNASTITSSQL